MRMPQSHVRCGAGEKVESGVRMPLRPYLSLLLILPDDGNMSVDELRDMVTTINATEVSAQDRLADSVYHYDAATRVFELGEKFEERQTQKENAKEERSSVLKDLKDKKQDMDLKPKAPGRPKTKDEPAIG